MTSFLVASVCGRENYFCAYIHRFRHAHHETRTWLPSLGLGAGVVSVRLFCMLYSSCNMLNYLAAWTLQVSPCRDVKWHAANYNKKENKRSTS